ncbi:MAG TPA: hypothetical protein VGM91_02865 [Conexibacter sp.]
MSDYFERIEQQLLDAVERNATSTRLRLRPGGAGGRVAIGTATAVCLLVAAVAALGLWATLKPDAAHVAPGAASGSLQSQLAVLRRPAAPGDAPLAVVAEAQHAARHARSPFNGTVDPRHIRRIATAPGGLGVYLAPVDRAGANASTSALLLAADETAARRRVWAPWGVTASALGKGAVFVQIGLRSTGGPHATGISGLRSLQLQLVPDGVASVIYQYSAVPARPLYPNDNATASAAVSSNAAVVMLRGRLAGSGPIEAVSRDERGATVKRVNGSLGEHAIAPRSVCAGVRLPANPTGVVDSEKPVIRRGGAIDRALAQLPARLPTMAGICRRAGAPVQAVKRDDGLAILRYDDGTVIGYRNGQIGTITHITSQSEFPPRFLDVLEPAPRLGR